MNLREITKKVGRNIGLNLPAVQLFTKQLLLALHHFRDCGVLHADIKPDNILINDRHNAVKVRRRHVHCHASRPQELLVQSHQGQYPTGTKSKCQQWLPAPLRLQASWAFILDVPSGVRGELVDLVCNAVRPAFERIHQHIRKGRCGQG